VPTTSFVTVLPPYLKDVWDSEPGDAPENLTMMKLPDDGLAGPQVGAENNSGPADSAKNFIPMISAILEELELVAGVWLDVEEEVVWPEVEEEVVWPEVEEEVVLDDGARLVPSPTKALSTPKTPSTTKAPSTTAAMIATFAMLPMPERATRANCDSRNLMTRG